MAIQDTDLFIVNNGASSYKVPASELSDASGVVLVNRGSASYKCDVANVKDKVLDTDFLLVNRGSNSYKILGSEVKTLFGSPLVSEGLLIYLDATDTNSYSGTGNTWYDVSGNNNDFTIYNTESVSHFTDLSAQSGVTAAGELQFLGTDATNKAYPRFVDNSVMKTMIDSGTFQLFWKPVGKVVGNPGRYISVANPAGTGGVNSVGSTDYKQFAAISSKVSTIALDWKNGVVFNSLNNRNDIDVWYNFTYTWETSGSNFILKVYDENGDIHEPPKGYPSSSSLWGDDVSTITMCTNSSSGSNNQIENANIAISQFLVYNRALTAEEIKTNVEAIKSSKFQGWS